MFSAADRTSLTKMKVSTPAVTCYIWVAGLPSVGAATPYAEYILAPTSRHLTPTVIHNVNGSVHGAEALITQSGAATFDGVSAVTYDFGKSVAGIVSFDTGQVSDENEVIGISFTESSLWISGLGCDATADSMWIYLCSHPHANSRTVGPADPAVGRWD